MSSAWATARMLRSLVLAGLPGFDSPRSSFQQVKREMPASAVTLSWEYPLAMRALAMLMPSSRA